VPGVLAGLAPLYAAAGVRRAALSTALDVVMSMPPETAGFYGPATSTVARINLARRAQFLVHSARRVQGDIAHAWSQGTPLLQTLRESATRERRFYGQHLQAGWNRANAAAAVDSAVMTHGNLLSWHAVLDARTSAECRAADRHNVLATEMPRIGYPGMVHPHCRCWPGAPIPGAPLVGSPRIRQPVYAGAP
jgi:hypothetical protein